VPWEFVVCRWNLDLILISGAKSRRSLAMTEPGASPSPSSPPDKNVRFFYYFLTVFLCSIVVKSGVRGRACFQFERFSLAFQLHLRGYSSRTRDVVKEQIKTQNK